MTYEKTLRSYRGILGALERPDDLKNHGEEILKWKGEVVEATLSRLNLTESTRGYVKTLLERFYDALISDEVEEFWRERYSGDSEDALYDISLDVRIFVISELLAFLSERIVRTFDRETAARLIPYLIRSAVSAIAFTESAYRDSEYEFLGIPSGLMDRIRKLGAGKGQEG